MNEEERALHELTLFQKMLERAMKRHEGALRRLAESERIDRERFEQGLDSKYGWPEDDEDDKTDA